MPFFPNTTDAVPALDTALDDKAESIAEAFADFDATQDRDDLDQMVYGVFDNPFRDVIEADEDPEDETTMGREITFILAGGGPGIQLVVLQSSFSDRIFAVKVVGLSMAGKVVRRIEKGDTYYRFAEHILHS